MPFKLERLNWGLKMGTLDNKVAVVLGASGDSNFGSVIARRLAKEGAKVVVAARRTRPLEALAADIGGMADEPVRCLF